MPQQTDITHQNTFGCSPESVLFNKVSKSSQDIECLRYCISGSANDGKRTLLKRFPDNDVSIKNEGRQASKVTSMRKFILSETPGLIGYAGDIHDGVSTPDVAIILIDAKNGIVDEAKRQSYISSILRIPTVILAINKMDLVNFSEEIYNRIITEFENTVKKLNLKKVYYIPISAENGDNVFEVAHNMSWYAGDSLLSLLENIPLKNVDNELAPRFPIQYANESQEERFGTSKGFTGRVSGGVFRVGDIVLALPHNKLSTVKGISDGGSELFEASTPQSVTLQLDGFSDLKKGDMLVRINKNYPKYSSKISSQICWLNDNLLQIGEKYIIRHTTDETEVIVTDIRYRVNFSTLEQDTAGKSVSRNDIAHITIKSLKPLKYDDYTENRITGSLIFVDVNTFETVGTGIIVSDEEVYSYNI